MRNQLWTRFWIICLVFWLFNDVGSHVVYCNPANSAFTCDQFVLLDSSLSMNENCDSDCSTKKSEFAASLVEKIKSENPRSLHVRFKTDPLEKHSTDHGLNRHHAPSQTLEHVLEYVSQVFLAENIPGPTSPQITLITDGNAITWASLQNSIRNIRTCFSERFTFNILAICPTDQARARLNKLVEQSCGSVKVITYDAGNLKCDKELDNKKSPCHCVPEKPNTRMVTTDNSQIFQFFLFNQPANQPAPATKPDHPGNVNIDLQLKFQEYLSRLDLSFRKSLSKLELLFQQNLTRIEQLIEVNQKQTNEEINLNLKLTGLSEVKSIFAGQSQQLSTRIDRLSTSFQAQSLSLQNHSLMIQKQTEELALIRQLLVQNQSDQPDSKYIESETNLSWWRLCCQILAMSVLAGGVFSWDQARRSRRELKALESEYDAVQKRMFQLEQTTSVQQSELERARTEITTLSELLKDATLQEKSVSHHEEHQLLMIRNEFFEKLKHQTQKLKYQKRRQKGCDEALQKMEGLQARLKRKIQKLTQEFDSHTELEELLQNQLVTLSRELEENRDASEKTNLKIKKLKHKIKNMKKTNRKLQQSTSLREQEFLRRIEILQERLTLKDSSPGEDSPHPESVPESPPTPSETGTSIPDIGDVSCELKTENSVAPESDEKAAPIPGEENTEPENTPRLYDDRPVPDPEIEEPESKPPLATEELDSSELLCSQADPQEVFVMSTETLNEVSDFTDPIIEEVSPLEIQQVEFEIVERDELIVESEAVNDSMISRVQYANAMKDPIREPEAAIVMESVSRWQVQLREEDTIPLEQFIERDRLPASLDLQNPNLVVPVRVDALFLRNSQYVAEASTDYARLPFVFGGLDRNPGQANLAEAIYSTPFENENLTLLPGVHLHWSLPDALTRGKQHSAGTEFPVVPNRWFITRRCSGQSDRQWVVESDYLYPPGTAHVHNAVSIPYDEPTFSFADRDLLQNFLEELSSSTSAIGMDLKHRIQDAFGIDAQKLKASYGHQGFTKLQLDQKQNLYQLEPGVISEKCLIPRDLNEVMHGNRYVIRLSADGSRRIYLEPQGKDPEKQKIEAKAKGKKVQTKNVTQMKYRVVGDDSLVEVLNQFVLGNTNYIDYQNEKIAPEDQFKRSVLNRQFLNREFPLSIGRIQNPAFRFMGRTLSYADWEQELKLGIKHDYLPRLTAVGNQSVNQTELGEPTFAAFYPNCRSVFGFFDSEFHGKIPEGLEYDVRGVYTAGSEANSPLAKFCPKLKNAPEMEREGEPVTLPDPLLFLDAFQKQFGWTFPVILHPQQLDAETAPLVLIDSDHPGEHRQQKRSVSEFDTLIEWGWLTEVRGGLQVVAPRQALKNPLAVQHAFDPLVQKLANLIQPLTDQFTSPAPGGRKKRISLECVGRLNFATRDTSAKTLNTPDFGQTEISLGYTGTEALSALTARFLADSGVYRAIIEEQLESVQVLNQYTNRNLDLGPKFREARHQREFLGTFAGTRWTLRQVRENRENAPAKADFDDDPILIPSHVSEKLNQLNLKQYDYDRSCNSLESLRKQLYSDWCKYMTSVYPPELTQDEYPDVDLIKRFVEVKATELSTLQGSTGQILITQEEEIQLVDPGNPGIRSHAVELKDQFDELQLMLTNFNQVRNDQKQPQYKLHAIASARYWQPREPVVAVSGSVSQRSLRHGSDSNLTDSEYLECCFHDSGGEHKADPQSVSTDMNPTMTKGMIEYFKSRYPAFVNNWKQQPWNPIMLEWKVLYKPLANLDQTPDADLSESTSAEQLPGIYKNDAITSQFQTQENQVQLSSTSTLEKSSSVVEIRGRSILTPYANDALQKDLTSYLNQQIYDAYARYQQDKFTDDQNNWLTSQDQIKNVINWYESSTLTNRVAKSDWYSDPVYTSLTSLLFLMQHQFLSQSLGGFNEALLQFHQIPQLQINDPIAFQDYDEFTRLIRKQIGKAHVLGPLPENEFIPLRAGCLELIHLRLIDTFGQTADVLNSKEEKTPLITCSEQMSHPDLKNEIWLAPRLVQPTRLEFRWLSADFDTIELNSHPAASPICGWLVPNNLDASLMVYDASGAALGAVTLNKDHPWQSAPGQPSLGIDEIQNSHLKEMVKYLVNKTFRDATYLKGLVLSLEKALENIEPENFEQHQAKALLMGRPIALVRASIKLEAQGLYANNQSWDALRRDMQSNSRETLAYENVQFPVRIGEYDQFNDGLVGFWMESEGGFAADFYVNDVDTANVADELFRQTQPLDERFQKQLLVINDFLSENHQTLTRDGFVKQFENGLEIWYELIERSWLIPISRTPAVNQSLAAEPEILNILMDPRGIIHANCGIVPTKCIQIPPEQYAQALRNIEVTFLTAPIISNDRQIQISLPQEEGFEWSWLEQKPARTKSGSRWRNITARPQIDKKLLMNQVLQVAEFWEEIAAETSGWLRIVPTPDQNPLSAKSGEAVLRRTVRIHYQRPKGDYGNLNSRSARDFWGIHTWDAARDPGWKQPLKPAGKDQFGIYFDIPLLKNEFVLGYIIHRGSLKDPKPDLFLDVRKHGYEVWQKQGAIPKRQFVSTTLPQIDFHPLKMFFKDIEFVASTRDVLTKQEFVSELSSRIGDRLWDYLVRQAGWIEEDALHPQFGYETSKFSEASPGVRTAGDKEQRNPGEFQYLEPLVRTAMSALQSRLQPNTPDALFVPGQTIREGWLKLSRVPAPGEHVASPEKTSVMTKEKQ